MITDPEFRKAFIAKLPKICDTRNNSPKSLNSSVNEEELKSPNDSGIGLEDLEVNQFSQKQNSSKPFEASGNPFKPHLGSVVKNSSIENSSQIPKNSPSLSNLQDYAKAIPLQNPVVVSMKTCYI